MARFQVQISPLRGILLGAAYSNEDIEGIETDEDDVRHILQVSVFLIMFNFIWYTLKDEE